MYTRYKLTLANRVTIPVGAVVGLGSLSFDK